MPRQWKIFRFASYFLLLLSLSITGIGTYFFVNQGNSSNAELVYFILFVSGGVVLGINFSLNIFILERFYPDGELPKSVSLPASIMLLLSCITIGLVTLVYAVEFYDVLVVSHRHYLEPASSRPVLTLAFGTILLIMYYYVFWMQVALRKTINRNRHKLYAAFPESK